MVTLSSPEVAEGEGDFSSDSNNPGVPRDSSGRMGCYWAKGKHASPTQFREVTRLCVYQGRLAFAVSTFRFLPHLFFVSFFHGCREKRVRTSARPGSFAVRYREFSFHSVGDKPAPIVGYLVVPSRHTPCPVRSKFFLYSFIFAYHRITIAKYFSLARGNLRQDRCK